MNKKIGFRSLIIVSIVFAAACLTEFSLIPTAFAQTPGKESDSIIELWKKQRQKSIEKRKGTVGTRAAGVVVPPELMLDGLVRQKAKYREMVDAGYKIPLDYADLVEKRSKGELVELPLADETFLLEIGGSVTDEEFKSFNFATGSTVLTPDSSEFKIIKTLADDFDGEKYDLNVPADRKQIKLRLLRMIDPAAKSVLDEISLAYFNEFNRPLRINALVRSLEYQIGLNAFNESSFRITGDDSLAPHSSGLAFDFSFKYMAGDEQNFIMKMAAEMERKGLVDAMRETGDSEVFHIFVYKDGKPPKVNMPVKTIAL